MYESVLERDVGIVQGWWGYSIELNTLKLPKVPLLLATLTDDQTEEFHKPMLEKGWRVVGWYPGCHWAIDDPNGNKVFLYSKEQDVPCLPEPPKREGYYEYNKWDFNKDMSLGCSCIGSRTRRKLMHVVYMHRIMGIHRRTRKDTKKVYGNWRKFSTTPLADYWFWGLLPNETDVHKYE